MKPTLQTTLILIVILVLGIGIGFESSEILMRRRFEKMESFRGQDGFLQKFDEVIQPDATQKPVVDSIIRKYHAQIERHAKTMFTYFNSMIDSMQTELKDKLTTDQVNRLNEEILRMKNPPPMHDHPQPPMKGQPPMMKEGPPPPHDRP